MVVQKGIEIRLYPDKEQKVFFAKTFGCARFVYNQCLRIKDAIYDETRLSFDPKLKSFKEEWPWLLEADSQALCQSYLDMKKAYRNFFDGRTGFPRYKSKHDRQSYRNCQPCRNIDELVRGNFIFLPKIGRVRCRYGNASRFNGIVKIYNVTVKKTRAGKYFCSICCDVDVEPLPPAGRVAGADIGIRNAVTVSDGTVYRAKFKTRKHKRRLRILQRRVSRKKKGGKNREKARLRLAAAHEKLCNRRKDFLHKVSRELVNRHDTICMETLNVKGMMKNHRLADAVADISFSELLRMVEYKASWYGRTVVKVDRWFPSSKLCSACGHKFSELRLGQALWTCPCCGSRHDRDINAAENILAEGMRILTEGTPRTGETGTASPSLRLAEEPTVDDRPTDLKSSAPSLSGKLYRKARGIHETHRSLAGG